MVAAQICNYMNVSQFIVKHIHALHHILDSHSPVYAGGDQAVLLRVLVHDHMREVLPAVPHRH